MERVRRQRGDRTFPFLEHPHHPQGFPAERWEGISNSQAPDLSAGLSNRRIQQPWESWGTFISPTPSLNYGELKGGWRGDEVGT